MFFYELVLAFPANTDCISVTCSTKPHQHLIQCHDESGPVANVTLWASPAIQNLMKLIILTVCVTLAHATTAVNKDTL